MTTLATQPMAISIASDDDRRAFQQCLLRAVRARFGADAAIDTVQRRRSEYSSSYETEIIDVVTEDGRSARLFMKNYGVFRNPKEEMPARREREMRVFRDLLMQTDIGTPRYYASEWDEAAGRYWLILEFVAGQQLRHVEYRHWVEAIAWLGRAQAHFKQANVKQHLLDGLIRQDEAFFRATAALALQVVGQLSGVLHQRLADVLRRYDQAIAIMAQQPQTLVHGAYRPPNVLVTVGESGQTERVCPIDWEEASLGSPLYDVAYLCDGFEDPRLGEMWDAYRHEAEAGGVPVPDREEMRRVVDCFRVHKLMNLLGKSAHRKYPLESVEKMIGMAGDLLRTIG